MTTEWEHAHTRVEERIICWSCTFHSRVRTSASASASMRELLVSNFFSAPDLTNGRRTSTYRWHKMTKNMRRSTWWAMPPVCKNLEVSFVTSSFSSSNKSSPTSSSRWEWVLCDLPISCCNLDCWLECRCELCPRIVDIGLHLNVICGRQVAEKDRCVARYVARLSFLLPMYRSFLVSIMIPLLFTEFGKLLSFFTPCNLSFSARKK